MGIDLDTLLPNLALSLDGTGFLFGAGTSREAGYPMMPALTRQVLSELKPPERALLELALDAANISYDEDTCEPNIEVLSDLVIAHRINSNDSRFFLLEENIKELILRHILSIEDPHVENHVTFINALKRRSFGLPCTVWIFTTNYDLLFEVAAAKANVVLENGFTGTTDRYFNSAAFSNVTGVIQGRGFKKNQNLVIKLVKLHGSVSWFSHGGQIYERHPLGITGNEPRLMVLPRKKKVMETLSSPYETLFNYAARIIGTQCKNIVSCGFSFGDEHINQYLLTPALNSRQCRLFALCESEPAGIAPFKGLPNFGAGFASSNLLPGSTTATPSGTDAWKFSCFSLLF